MDELDDATIDEAIRQACERAGIRAGDAFWVKRVLLRPTAPPACCGSGCDPCIEDVVAAAAYARKLLDARGP